MHAIAGLKLPIARVGSLLKKGSNMKAMNKDAKIYGTALTEYLLGEIVDSAARVAHNDHRKKRVTPRHLMLAVKGDKELNRLIGTATHFLESGVVPHINKRLQKKKVKNEAAQDL